MLTDKKELSKELLNWLNHKRVLASKSNYYKQSLVAKSITTTYNLLKFLQRNCNEYTMETLCKMILIYEKQLKLILPASKNPSYLSQLIKLNNIIEAAKNFKK